eukprot:5656999-Prymnesium_polylepis.1
MYLVPQAPQSRVALEYRLPAHDFRTKVEPAPRFILPHYDGSARYVGGTLRLPISPLIDTYLVPGCQLSPGSPGRQQKSPAGRQQ